VYNVQRVSIESCVTNLSLPVMENLRGRPSHLSAYAVKSNIMMLSALGFWPMNFRISIRESGQNRR